MRYIGLVVVRYVHHAHERSNSIRVRAEARVSNKTPHKNGFECSHRTIQTDDSKLVDLGLSAHDAQRGLLEMFVLGELCKKLSFDGFDAAAVKEARESCNFIRRPKEIQST